MRKIKDVPLAVWHAIEPYFKKRNSLFTIVDKAETLLLIKDSDPESSFFFQVKDFEIRNGKTLLNIHYKPQTNQDTNALAVKISQESLKGYFDRWVKILEQYEKLELSDNDPIVNANAEKFYSKFKVEILDEAADLVSFDLDQQLFLEEYLENTKTKLLELKAATSSKEKKQQLVELANDTDQIRQVLTSESKRQIVKRLSKFWGKAQKVGLDVIKEIFVSVTAELIKRLLIGG